MGSYSMMMDQVLTAQPKQKIQNIYDKTYIFVSYQLGSVFSFKSEGKNVKRSIHGMGQMMSTMVLNRKQSLFGGAGARGAGVGAGLAIDGQRGSKDSIDKMDLTVMDTKLKILEILQVLKTCLRVQT